MEKVKEQKSFISEFRILEKELGSTKSDALMNFLIKYNEILMENLVTKADFERGNTEFHKTISNLSWKLAAMIIAQTAVFFTLFKLLS